jgi:hypothetical protein
MTEESHNRVPAVSLDHCIRCAFMHSLCVLQHILYKLLMCLILLIIEKNKKESRPLLTVASSPSLWQNSRRNNALHRYYFIHFRTSSSVRPVRNVVSLLLKIEKDRILPHPAFSFIIQNNCEAHWQSRLSLPAGNDLSQ